MTGPLVIAIDGAAGSGKSTLSRGLARVLDLPYVNTGSMYRALAAAAIRANVSPDDEVALLELMKDLRFTLEGGSPRELVVEGYPPAALTTPQVESTVSTVSRHPRVRGSMRDRQRVLGRDGAVMEGRDIASVVFPDAGVKLFLRAGERLRTKRRADERGVDDAAAVASALRDRDELDARTNALEAVAGAIVIDTEELDVEATLAAALAVVRATWPGVGA